MTYAAKTIFGFGCYLLALGVSLLLFPNAVLAVFGIAPTNEVWIRVVGMLVLFLGSYYGLAAAVNLHQFFHWTIPLRASVIVFFAVFVSFYFAGHDSGKRSHPSTSSTASVVTPVRLGPPPT